MATVTIDGTVDQIAEVMNLEPQIDFKSRKGYSRVAVLNRDIIRRRKIVHAAFLRTRYDPTQKANAMLFVQALIQPAPISEDVVAAAEALTS